MAEPEKTEQPPRRTLGYCIMHGGLAGLKFIDLSNRSHRIYEPNGVGHYTDHSAILMVTYLDNDNLGRKIPLDISWHLEDWEATPKEVERAKEGQLAQKTG